MKNNYEYGDAICITAFYDIYDYNINIFMKDNRNKIISTYISKSGKFDICHLIYGSNHYDIAY